MKTGNRIQEIQLDLIELASFNCLDGRQVRQDLLANQDLWKGAIIGRFDNSLLLPLRDIALHFWNVDTLMILPQPGKEKELLALTADWGADEVELMEGRDIAMMYGGLEDKVLRVWWD